MHTRDNTILITGGGTGIGRGLAEAFHSRGNRVIIAGRRKAALDETTTANPGMASMVLDIDDAGAVRDFARRVASDHPGLNVLINNAGIGRIEHLREQPEDLADAEAIVTTNVLGPIRLTAALLPLLLKQPRATVMNVSSGLAFVPLAVAPTYSATKAALHSYTQSLRAQLKGTSTEVIELIPPGVQTDLLPGSATNPRMMPLAAYITEAMAILDAQPEAVEVCVERVNFHRLAEAQGRYDETFDLINGSTH